jgi:hypothetical protein
MARPTFEAREVTLGSGAARTGRWRADLTEGELVVVNGAFRIDSELQIRGRPSMMGAPPAHDHGPATPRDTRTVPVQLSRAAGEQLERVAVAYLEVANALSRDDAAAAGRRQGSWDRRCGRRSWLTWTVMRAGNGTGSERVCGPAPRPWRPAPTWRPAP